MKPPKFEKFRDFFLTHTNAETKKKFGLSDRLFEQVRKMYGLTKPAGRPRKLEGRKTK